MKCPCEIVSKFERRVALFRSLLKQGTLEKLFGFAAPLTQLSKKALEDIPIIFADMTYDEVTTDLLALLLFEPWKCMLK